jgi:uncharacterized protein YkwD
MLQLKRAPQAAPAPEPPKPVVLAAADGFELRLLNENFAGEGQASYMLAIADAPAGGVEVSVNVDSAALTSCELQLDYPHSYSPQGGQAQPWPGDDEGRLAYNVNLDTPGHLVYTARLRDEAAQRGSSGAFTVLRLVFAEALQAPVAQPEPTPAAATPQPAPTPTLASAPVALPTGNARQWLASYYLTLPPLSGPYSVYGDSSWQQAADEVFALANAARAKKGQPALLRDAHLDAVAQAHAVDMAREGYFEHKNLLGMEVFERLNAVGAPAWWAAGENIAAGQRSPEEAHTSWMNSSGHKVNIRGEKYQRLGIGVYYDANSPYGWYWVQVFASYDEQGTGAHWLEPGQP